MAIIPTVRCRSMRVSVAFYTDILDFDRVDAGDRRRRLQGVTSADETENP